MYNSQLTTFVQVADSGSFNKAAEALYISSTAVIKQINALEKHLDLTLFSRTNHGIALTESGRIIYKHARKLFAYSEKAIAEARLAAAEAATTFCVGTSILNPCKPFMDLWYRVSEQLPGFKLHIVPFEDDHEGILREIAALGEKFDFLIGACDSRQWLDRCNFLPLSVSSLRGRSPGTSFSPENQADHPGPLWTDADDGQAGRLPHSGPGPGLCGETPCHCH